MDRLASFDNAIYKGCQNYHESFDAHGPLTRYEKLRFVHAPGMPSTFSRHRLQRKLLVSDPGMHHGTCATHVPWCMSGSLTRCGGENFHGICGAYTTLNFTYLVDSIYRYSKLTHMGYLFIIWGTSWSNRFALRRYLLLAKYLNGIVSRQSYWRWICLRHATDYPPDTSFHKYVVDVSIPLHRWTIIADVTHMHFHNNIIALVTCLVIKMYLLSMIV